NISPEARTAPSSRSDRGRYTKGTKGEHKKHSAATPQPMAMTLPFGRNLNASYSPPRRGGVAAPSKKCREATKAAQTGWSVRLAFRRGAELTTPPRQIGTDPYFGCRGHPSSARRGMCAPKNFVQKTKSCSLVTQKENTKSTKICAFCV